MGSCRGRLAPSLPACRPGLADSSLPLAFLASPNQSCRERGQNEVFTGGLSSYSLFNMVGQEACSRAGWAWNKTCLASAHLPCFYASEAHTKCDAHPCRPAADPPTLPPITHTQVMAHLQCEGFKPDLSGQQTQQTQQGQQGQHWLRGRPQPPRPPLPPQPADLQQTLAFLQRLAAGALPAMSEAATAAHAAGQRRGHVRFGDDEQEGVAAAKQQQQQQQADLGVLLWGFFDRFGEACRPQIARRAGSARVLLKLPQLALKLFGSHE